MFVVLSVVMTLIVLLLHEQVGGVGLDKVLPAELVLAGYWASCQCLYDVIWWRWQRWRLLVVANAVAYGCFLLVEGMLNSWLTFGRWWVEFAVTLGLAGGILYTATWWLRRNRLQAEGWRW